MYVFLFHILFRHGLSQDTEYSSPCCAAGPCCLPIPHGTVCTCWPQPPTPSLPLPLPTGNHQAVLCDTAILKERSPVIPGVPAEGRILDFGPSASSSRRESRAGARISREHLCLWEDWGLLGPLLTTTVQSSCCCTAWRWGSWAQRGWLTYPWFHSKKGRMRLESRFLVYSSTWL